MNKFGIILELRNGSMWATIPYETDCLEARQELQKIGKAYARRRKATKEALELLK